MTWQIGGSFQLVPVEDRMQAIARNCRNMDIMMFGETFALEGIMEKLAALEQEINR